MQFLAYMQMLEPCLADFVPFHSHRSSPLYVNTVYHFFTELLLALSLSCHSQFKALLNQVNHPAGKDTCAPLCYMDPLFPKQILILKQGPMVIETKPSW